VLVPILCPTERNPFSLHNLCLHGRRAGVVPGRWLGPWVMCRALEAAAAAAQVRCAIVSLLLAQLATAAVISLLLQLPRCAVAVLLLGFLLAHLAAVTVMPSLLHS
jgi:hypothetical protein